MPNLRFAAPIERRTAIVTVNHQRWETYVRYRDGREQRFTDTPHNLSSGTSRNLVDVILGRAENGAPAEIGVQVVELLDAAYRSSAADGLPIPIDSLGICCPFRTDRDAENRHPLP